MNILYKIIDPIRSKENKKRRYALVLVLLLLCSFAAFFAWSSYKSDNLILPPLTEEEQELLGEWKCEYPGPPIQKDFGYTLLPDHKCIKRWYVPGTDDIKYENDEFRWWREGDRLTIRYRKGAGRKLISIGAWSWTQYLDEDRIYDLTPAGPGQFNTAESLRIETVYDTPRPSGSGKLFRVERNGN